MPKFSADYAVAQKPNYSGFVVIGAGLPRTGTMSLRAALGELLDGASYHMLDVFTGSSKDTTFWNELLDSGKTPAEFKDFLEGSGFRSGVDFPISMFYKELMIAFPQAKVVLTVRNPETWHTSVKSTIHKISKIIDDFACVIFLKLIGQYDNIRTVTRIASHPPKGFSKGLFPMIDEDSPEVSTEFFNKWVAEVKRSVPQDRLLVFECKEGWKPLCKFLDLPIPDEPFPRVNDTPQLMAAISKIKRTSYTFVYGLPVVLMGVASAYLAYTKGYFRNPIQRYSYFSTQQ